ncbi:MAG: hypothetical protein IKA90_05090, partial [Clostridia bacterium]|nr:hypothetical protein [Clostridia bacterium]
LACGDAVKNSINISISPYILSIIILVVGIIQVVFSFFLGFDAPFYFYSDRVERKKLWKKRICSWDNVMKCEKKQIERLPYSTICTDALVITTNDLKQFTIPLSKYLVYEIIRENCSNKNIIDIMDN